MTEKLYDADSHMKEFAAEVLSCRRVSAGWEVITDRTAFFPEGGGQSADTGTLGGERLLRADERAEGIVHLCTGPLEPGSRVSGVIDWEPRFRRMQGHSGEHIVSGIAHRLYGAGNVGFHMGRDGMTVDFDRELLPAQIALVERLANETVARDLPVRCYYPAKDELAGLDYRSKLELTENVRLVAIGEADLCACCAPHVSRTGEIGVIKILESMRHRGGVRLRLLCGFDALEDYTRRCASTAGISALLSVPQEAVLSGVERLLSEKAAIEREIAALRRRAVLEKAAGMAETEGNVCFFEADMDMDSLRELVNAGMERCGGVCAAFSGSDGAWRYIMGSRGIDLRARAGEINAAIGGRGGGKPAMIQGGCGAKRDKIEGFFANFA